MVSRPKLWMAEGQGVAWGVVMGIVISHVDHRGVVLALAVFVSCGVLVYGPLVHAVALRRWGRQQRRMLGVSAR